MSPVFVGRLPPFGQAQKCLMDQSGGIERPRLTGAPQVRRGQLLELTVYKWNHRLESLLVPGLNALQKFGDLHGR
jgi:hypothetical protein